MRLAVPIVTVALAASLLAGCGSSSDESSQTGPAALPATGTEELTGTGFPRACSAG